VLGLLRRHLPLIALTLLPVLADLLAANRTLLEDLRFKVNQLYRNSGHH
jgi:hypothetical protein